MVSCPVCSNQILRHIRHDDVYWFCSHCWQELPHIPSPRQQNRTRYSRLESHLARCLMREVGPQLASVSSGEPAIDPRSLSFGPLITAGEKS